ncbi:pyridoxamine 5'-phosphate oxidase family protein [Nonomuraea polychroma]|uniref:pyridoxamine 5'-phosphate oxidase family protein n=1 Tax=Nonomuraea polychroma TaxID=46176 RepID=UPI003D8BDCDD
MISKFVPVHLLQAAHRFGVAGPPPSGAESDTVVVNATSPKPCWADVQTRVAEADDFLLATTDPDGRPHVVPVLGVWLEGTVCFVTFRQARKARNLARNNGCAVTVPGHDVDVVLEGAARLMRNAARLQKVADLFPAKYPWWHPFVRDGEFYDPADTPSMILGTSTRLSRHRCSHSVRRKGSAPPAGASRCSDRTRVPAGTTHSWESQGRTKGNTPMTTMTPNEWRSFVTAGTRLAHIALTRAYGRPHVTPVCFILGCGSVQ